MRLYCMTRTWDMYRLVYVGSVAGNQTYQELRLYPSREEPFLIDSSARLIVTAIAPVAWGWRLRVYAQLTFLLPCQRIS
jgi:hypothetical protein